ncbi:hypothetical protein ADK35_39175, partial [Streptomyces viridochromogenes]
MRRRCGAGGEGGVPSSAGHPRGRTRNPVTESRPSRCAVAARARTPRPEPWYGGAVRPRREPRPGPL